METTIDAAGRIVVPKPLRDALGLAPGTTVAILVHAFGLWSLNACRIVYVMDDHEDAGVRRFGFAYGTLAEHAESGEERFSVEWNRSDGAVWYASTFAQQDDVSVDEFRLPGCLAEKGGRYVPLPPVIGDDRHRLLVVTG